MCSRFLSLVAVCGLSVAGDGAALRVCSDPNNLPFSNEKSEGFENRIAELIARELGRKLEYTWFAQRRGFIRNTLRAGVCDVVMGVPAHFDPVDTTRPYYRSTYVFVSREDRHLNVSSMNDPALKRLQIGVHIVGDDYSNPPPVHALGRRHIVQNVSGYSIYGDYSQPNPPARLLEAVAAGKVDVAVVWGPFAGYFGSRQAVPLKIVAVTPESDGPTLPFVFDIAMGVRKGDKALRDQLQKVLDRRRVEIQRILHEYGVPLKALRGAK
jgi:quinoprotein dehydrogenase-associated probable ABC transporter substrate-binding protein